MDSLFLAKVIISFFVAGIWISAATLLAERMGSKIGGLIANLPSNILVGLLFLYFVYDTDYVISVVPSVPIGMLINTCFLSIYVVLLKRGLISSTIISLIIWFALAAAAGLITSTNLWINFSAYIIITFVSFFVLEKSTKIPAMAKSNKKYSKTQIMIRAAFAGGIVASVILISKFLSPYFVGIFSTFPAVLLSTVIILSLNQNIQFAQATGKVLILSSTNITIYAIAVYFTYPAFGVLIGTVISFAAAVIWVWLFHPIVQRLK